MQTNSRWSGPPVREVVWEAVQRFTDGDVDVEFAIKDIKPVVLEKYPGFNVRTIGAQIAAGCVNGGSRQYHPTGMDLYWKVRYGVYCLYETDRLSEFTTAEFNVNLNEVDLNNFIIDEVQPSLLASEPEEEEQEVPEGEHRYFVYAWRWCGDERFAKIGRTRNGLKGVKKRMVTTYHPTDDPVPLGVRKCADAEESHKTEQYILNGLERTRPDREWVEIDEVFNEMISKSFISDSDELKRIFGENIKTEKVV